MSKEKLFFGSLAALLLILLTGIAAEVRSPGSVSEKLEAINKQLFGVSQIKVSGNYRIPAEQILESAGLWQRDFLVWEISKQKVAESIKQNAWFEDCEVELDYFPIPSLSISLREAEPWLIADLEGNTWLVSSTGAFLENLSTLKNSELIMEVSELPRIEGLHAEVDKLLFLPSPNARFEYVIKMLRFVEAAGGLPFAVERYKLLEEGSIQITPLYYLQSPKVLLKIESFSEAENRLSELNAVIEDLHKRGEKPAQIDLRFKGQAIITYLESPPKS